MEIEHCIGMGNSSAFVCPSPFPSQPLPPVFSHYPLASNLRAFTIFTTLFLISTSSPEAYPPHTIELWAGFLGLTSAALAVIQYAPQIYMTWKHKLVGALSIPMMCIQTPGAILMVTNLAIRCVPSGFFSNVVGGQNNDDVDILGAGQIGRAGRRTPQRGLCKVACSSYASCGKPASGDSEWMTLASRCLVASTLLFLFHTPDRTRQPL
jgi:PQ loop repeat